MDKKSNKKLNKKEIQIIKEIFTDIVWMAIRYANGRSTYAPSVIRDSIEKIKKIFPDFELIYDQTIQPPDEEQLRLPNVLQSDYLYDLFEKK